MYSLSKVSGLFDFSNETNGKDNQLKCQLGDSEMEIKSQAEVTELGDSMT